MKQSLDVKVNRSLEDNMMLFFVFRNTLLLQVCCECSTPSGFEPPRRVVKTEHPWGLHQAFSRYYLLCAGVWLHGEAVSAGTVMAADMSVRLGWIDPSIASRTKALLEKAKLPTEPPKVSHLKPFQHS